jgi:outer membrane protein assembly factor BamB
MKAFPLLVMVLLVLSAVDFAASQQVGTMAQSVGNANSWPNFTLNYQDSRYNPDSGINPSNVCHLQPAWNFSTSGASVTSEPIVANGSVYFGDWSGNAYSLNLSNGALNWKTLVHAHSEISGTPAVVDGVVYITSLTPPIVYALNQTTGKLIWSTTLWTGPVLGIWDSPTIFRGDLYIGLGAANSIEDEPQIHGQLDALNVSSGKILWTFTTANETSPGNGVWSSVVVDPDSDAIYFGTGNPYGNATYVLSSTPDLYSDSLIALNATNGKLIWYNQVVPADVQDRDFGATPNLFNYTSKGVQYAAVGLGSKGGYYYIFDRASGKLLAKVALGTISIGDTGLVGSGANTELFIPTYDYIIALFPGNLTKPWMAEGIQVVGSVALSQGLVFFGDTAGNLEALSMASGQELFGVKLPVGIWGSVTVASGYLLTGTSELNIGEDMLVSANQTGFGVYAYSLGQDTSVCNYPALTTTTSASATAVTSVYSSTTTQAPVTSQTTGSSKSAQGGVPEFPYQVAAVTILTVGVVVSYLAFGRRPSNRHST